MKLISKKTFEQDVSSKTSATERKVRGNSFFSGTEDKREVVYTTNNTLNSGDGSVRWDYQATSGSSHEGNKVTRHEYIAEWSIPGNSDNESAVSAYGPDFIVDWR